MDKKKTLLYTASFIAAGVLTTCILYLTHIYPFGDTSLLKMDMDIQYIDFFRYLRQCLLGKDSILYSFHKSLGGAMTAGFTYYLSSPLNLFVIFFKDMHLFIAFITIVKIALCSLSMTIYLKGRFPKLHEVFILTLSFGFALGNYNLIQSSNIMWLDGVYMLPLIMLGIYRYVKNGNGIFFSVCVGLNIIFCWYTGYMNCMFAVLYYIYESFLNEVRIPLFKRLKEFLVFCFYEGMGVLLSSVLFLSTVIELLKGKGIQDREIFIWNTTFSWWELLKGFFYSQDSIISLFCGTLTILAVIGFFLSKKIGLRQKLASFILLFIMLISMQVKALENIWNGFRFASYFCRFSFLSIVVLIIIAAAILEKMEKREDYRILLISSIIMGIIISITSFVLTMDKRISMITLSVIFVYFVLFAVLSYKLVTVTVGLAGILLFTSTEVTLQGRKVFKSRYKVSASIFPEYEKKQAEIVDSIQDLNPGFYRIDETQHRKDYKSGTTSFLNEGLAYSYNSIAHYSSAFDRSLMNFLIKMGYFDTSEATIYNEPILSADSLLGLKYLLSEKSYDEYIKIARYDIKDVYENPYALSAAYGASEKLKTFKDQSKLTPYMHSFTTRSDNPFIYQNKLYSAILGEEVTLYKPVEYNLKTNIDTLETKVTLDKKNGQKLYYGWMDSDERLKVSNLSVDGERICQYSYWNCFSVFNIGKAGTAHEVTLSSYVLPDKNLFQVYELDLDVFSRVIEQLKRNQAEVKQISHKELEMHYTATNDSSLFITIPYDSSWRITVNGKEAKKYKVCDSLMMVDVKKGENIIHMEYRYPYITYGVILSIAGIIILSFIYFRKRKVIK